MGQHKLPKGFSVNGIHCGFKRKRKDLSLIFSERPCRIAAMFTRNSVKAAPVTVAEKLLKKRKFFRAVLVNSGNANCLTGEKGVKDCLRMSELAANALGVLSDEVLVSSTGVIGRFMDLSPLKHGLPQLVKGLSVGALEAAAKGIMTTDRFPKIASREITVAGTRVTLTGIAKGAGMVKPDMATMLCYIMTDAAVTEKAMKKALRTAVEDSFNRITVDGEMSTNDTVMLIANGMAKNKAIPGNGADQRKFAEAVASLSLELAEMIVLDGEGANKRIEVVVSSARTSGKARRIAEAVADSLLVKCAVLGEDPNWGRVASSAGSTKEDIDISKMEILLDGRSFYRNGKPLKVNPRQADKVFKARCVKIELKLNEGDGRARYFSCDISKEYIDFNAHYTS